MRIVQSTMRLTLGVCDIRPQWLDTFPATFALFPVLRRGYAHVQLRWFYMYLLSTFDGAHVRKNTRLSTPAQLQCSRSGAWEHENEAISQLY